MRPEPVEGPPLDLSAPVLLDGGLATQLEAQGADLRSRLWSAQLLLDDPAAVVAAHEAFFAAGAQVATTASYQAPVELIGLSVRLAQQARDAFLSEGERWVAGSVGPYGASLADGSEYRGDYGRSVAELRAWHRPRIAALVEAGVDVLALETIPTPGRGRGPAAGGGRHGRPVLAVDHRGRRPDPGGGAGVRGVRSGR